MMQFWCRRIFEVSPTSTGDSCRTNEWNCWMFMKGTCKWRCWMELTDPKSNNVKWRMAKTITQDSTKYDTTPTRVSIVSSYLEVASTTILLCTQTKNTGRPASRSACPCRKATKGKKFQFSFFFNGRDQRWCDSGEISAMMSLLIFLFSFSP